VWQVVVQSRQRLDVHSSVGCASTADLVVRGDRYARRARAYALPSPADVVHFKPDTVFQLVPGAYNRVALSVTPKMIGYRYCRLLCCCGYAVWTATSAVACSSYAVVDRHLPVRSPNQYRNGMPFTNNIPLSLTFIVTIHYVHRRHVQLNLVDEDSRELVSAWLMTVAATSPAVMRSYDVDVPGTLRVFCVFWIAVVCVVGCVVLVGSLCCVMRSEWWLFT
jgi:hypothetical protein